MSASNYSAHREEAGGFEVVRLADAAHDLRVSIVPSIGNMAYEILAHGRNILWFPYPGPAELRANPKHCGIPFLGPWANRIDGDTYWVNGKPYRLNPDLGNLRRDAHNLPIHGVLNFSPAWKLVSVDAGDRSASATSRLAFSEHPEMMAQFPFAHTVTMTHRLADGVVEVETTIESHCVEPMPVAVGYHPYFQIPGVSRDEWQVRLAAREHVELNDRLTPTGLRKPVDFPSPLPLKGKQFDDVFSGLVRDADGRAHFQVETGNQRIMVSYGPKYTIAVVFAPPGRDFICFEPMAAVTNAFNLAHAGVYSELQNIAPGGEWKESFRIAPQGF